MRGVLIVALATALYGATFDEIKDMIKNNNPKLKSIKYQIDASGKKAELASRYQNPSLSLILNDINLGSPFSRDLEAMQSQGIVISQKIPTANKLEFLKKSNLFLKESKRVEYDLVLRKLFLEADVSTCKVTSIDKKLKVLKRYKTLAKYAKSLIEQYVKSINIPHTAIIKSEILISEVETKIIDLKSKKEIYLKYLSSLTDRKIDSVERELVLKEINSLDYYKKYLDTHPKIKYLKELIRAKKEEIKYYKALKTPDVKVSGGYYNRENRDDYISLSLSMQLPIYKREETQSLIAFKELDSLEKIYSDEKLKLLYGLKKSYLLAKDSIKRYKIYNKIINQDISHQLDILLENISSNIALAENSVEVIEKSLQFELKKIDILYDYNEALSNIRYFTEEKR